jgi:putative transposase
LLQCACGELLQQPEERTGAQHALRYATRQEAIADLFDYIEFVYYRSRRHSTLGYHSPVQFLKDWITNQHEQKMA